MVVHRAHFLLGFFLAAVCALLLWGAVPLLRSPAADILSQPIDPVLPKGIASLSARECGTCHGEIYQEWSESMHARAWSDAHYQAELAYEKHNPLCLGCHTPLKPQRESLAGGTAATGAPASARVANPGFDSLLRDEGVTCAACHVRNGEIIGPYPTTQAPHPVKVAPAALSGANPCRDCHMVTQGRWEALRRLPPCGTVETTGREGKEADCVGCHLPNVTRAMANNVPTRQGGRHLFQGGHHPPQVARALKVDHRREEVDGRSSFVFTLTNVGTDHPMPTGTLDRHLTLEFRLRDDQNIVTHEKIHRIQRTVLGRSFVLDFWDRRLAAREPRAFVYELPKGDVLPRPAFLEVTIRYHLLDEKRRKRIGYENTTPLSYAIYHERFDLSGGS
ncbi:MAG: hypothetical protein HQL66_12215 [Magnetococcales bacterium]|nr:hypothetical protein [Magnetococcales bacterium]